MNTIRIFIRHEVADYALWKKHYDDFSNYQKTHGVINEFVYQSTDNPNSITVIHDFNNIEEAKSFVISEEFKSFIFRSGVKGVYQISYTRQSHQ